MSDNKRIAVIAAATAVVASSATLLISQWWRRRQCKKSSPVGKRVAGGVVQRVTRFIDTNGVERLGQLVDGDHTTAQLIEGPLLGEQFLLDTRVGVKKILAPIAVPPAIICIGLNYKPHAKESKMAVPTYPVVFFKNPAAIIGPGDNIVIPACSKLTREQMDWEVEMAVIIGKPCKNVSKEDALNYVAGYCVAHDVSERGWQLDSSVNGTQWNRGKGFDSFCPLGPWMVKAPFDVSDVQLTCNVNGEEKQNGRTRDMIFNVPYLVSFLSQDTTLLPGTVILTGTPEGIGWALKPPVFLKAGDEVTVAITGMGTLTNKVVAASS